MKLRTKLMLCTVFVTMGTAALAVDLPAGEVTRSAIETAYAGFEQLEVKYGPTQVKVEAIDAETGQKVETVYDRLTGSILASETYLVVGQTGSGSEFASTTEDFVDSASDDGADDTSGSDDDGVDDTSGGDDDGADDTSGSDDDGADDSSGSDGSDGGDDSSGGGDDDGGDDSSGGGDDDGDSGEDD